MANVKITDLTALSGALVGADLFEMVDDVAGTPVSRKVTAAVLRDFTNMAQATGTDADTTMAINTLYVVDMSAWATADRTYTLPATAAVGDRIGVMVTAGDASHELIITAASGDTLNGIAGGTEWSRLFITGEVVVMRCVAANATWMVVQDGRIPQKCDMELTTSCDGEGINTFTRPTQCSTAGVWTARVDVGSLASVSQDRITVRRAGNYNVLIAGRVKDSSADGANFNVACYQNAGATLVLLGGQQPGAIAQPIASSARLLPLVADDYLVYQYRTTAGSLGQQSGQTWFDVLEVLP